MDGEVIEIPTESPQDLLISLFLPAQFLQLVPIQQLRRMDTELVVAGRVRMPDLMILGEALAAVLLASGHSTITAEMPAPLLTVEVVSPGKANEVGIIGLSGLNTLHVGFQSIGLLIQPGQRCWCCCWWMGCMNQSSMLRTIAFNHLFCRN